MLMGTYVYLFATGAFARKPAEDQSQAAPAAAAAPGAENAAPVGRVAVFPGSKSTSHVVPGQRVVYGDGPAIFPGSKYGVAAMIQPPAGANPAGDPIFTLDQKMLLSGSKSARVLPVDALTATPSAGASPPIAPPALAPPVSPPSAEQRTLLLAGSKSYSGLITVTGGTITLNAANGAKPAAAPATQGATRPTTLPTTRPANSPTRLMMLPGSKSLIVVPPGGDQPQQPSTPTKP